MRFARHYYILQVFNHCRRYRCSGLVPLGNLKTNKLTRADQKVPSALLKLIIPRATLIILHSVACITNVKIEALVIYSEIPEVIFLIKPVSSGLDVTIFFT